MTPAVQSSVSRVDPTPTFTPRQWRQIGWITLVAVVVFAVLRWLPTGTNLSHMDFRVDAKNSIDFCDPLNPQFIPVVAVASPVAMTLDAPPARPGEPVRGVVKLTTAGGKTIGVEDLLVVHTKRLHLLIADPALADYQHVHPEPSGRPGEWAFEFTPRTAGVYRIFADFTPAATNRGLYAHADLPVGEPAPAADGLGERPAPATAVTRDGYRFALTPAVVPFHARKPIDLQFTVTNLDGGDVPLEPVMDAYAHLVAFDAGRTGFAHLHPMEADLSKKPDGRRPLLNFKVTIPTAGHYVVWAQVKLNGREVFVPFWFDVMP